MKTAILSFGVVLAAAAALAQANPGDQRISSPPPGALNAGSTNTPGQIPPQGSITATNQAGQTYALGELGSQLAGLKTAVEQTLPTLTAFNAKFASTTPGSSRSQELANAISGVLSSALGRNSNSTSSGTTGFTNFTQALNGLISTNSATGSTNLNPATLNQLRTLQADLTPVLNILQNLDLGSGANTLPNALGPAPAFSRRGAAPSQAPTPTGR